MSPLTVETSSFRRLQFQLAICHTARNAYAVALQGALPKDQ
jgi:hypothetical protein